MNIWKFLRCIEGVILFVVLPVLVYNNLLPIPKIAALLIVTLVCVCILWADASYTLARLSYRPHVPGQWQKILARSALVAVSLVVLTLFLQPEELFEMPMQRPAVWFTVMLLYPLLSALPQEIVYREFFFHRYRDIIGSGWLLVAASAAAFSFLHIVYDNNWAIIISLIGGFLFARSYRETRSLYWVSVEHAIYGCLIFTIGMGSYFFEGV